MYHAYPQFTFYCSVLSVTEKLEDLIIYFLSHYLCYKFLIFQKMISFSLEVLKQKNNNKNNRKYDHFFVLINV